MSKVLSILYCEYFGKDFLDIRYTVYSTERQRDRKHIYLGERDVFNLFREKFQQGQDVERYDKDFINRSGKIESWDREK